MQYDPEDAETITRSSFRNWDSIRKASNVFVGLALSGGGSRAANFSAAVLQYLNSHGFLKHVKAISAVSGSSLVAIEYGLHGENASPTFWNNLKNKVLTNFEAPLYLMLANPWKATRRYFSHYDRSDMMMEVWDEKLDLDGKTFWHLNETWKNGPKILINATQAYADGTPFVFIEEEFRKLNSRLDTYPLSAALQASAAVPMIFNNVTLKNYNPEHIKWFQIKGPERLLRKFYNPDESDPIATHIHKNRRASPEDLDDLLSRRHTTDQKRHLAGSFLEPLYKDQTFLIPERFANVPLKEKTRKLLAEHTPFAPRVRLTRRILSEVYPDNIEKGQDRFVHLYDGGISDNLGLQSLLRAVDGFFHEEKKKANTATYTLNTIRNIAQKNKPNQSKERSDSDIPCFLFIVDSQQEGIGLREEYSPDTRSRSDYIFDANGLDALDAIYSVRRKQAVRSRVGEDKIGVFSTPSGHQCLAWHIGLSDLANIRKLLNPGFYGELIKREQNAWSVDGPDYPTNWQLLLRAWEEISILHHVTSQIDTAWRLKGPKQCSSEFLQQSLYTTAQQLLKGLS